MRNKKKRRAREVQVDLLDRKTGCVQTLGSPFDDDVHSAHDLITSCDVCRNMKFIRFPTKASSNRKSSSIYLGEKTW